MNFTKTAYEAFFLVIGMGLAVNGYSQSFLTNGLVAYYPFSGDVHDQTANANNGVSPGAGPVLTTDRFNGTDSAYIFNGINASISAANRDYLSFPNGGDFSISIWAALNKPPSPVMYFLGMDNGAGGKPKWILSYGQLNLPNAPTGNYVSFLTTGGTNVGYALAATPFTAAIGVWHQYLVAKAGTNYSVYIDGSPAVGATNYEDDNGVLKIGVDGPGSIPAGITAPLTIGDAEFGGYVDGKLDDIRIYNRALSASEVQQLYFVESAPVLNVRKAVYLDSLNLMVGTNYQLQVSTDLNTWTNYGSPFSATNSTWRSTNYWDVPNWDQLFFRLQADP